MRVLRSGFPEILEEGYISYVNLVRIRTKAYRNGNWGKLKQTEKGLFKASVSLAKLRGRLVSRSLLTMLSVIVSKLLHTVRSKILQLGESKARQLFELYEMNGVLNWLPQVRQLLDDGSYVLWLGVRQMTLASIGA